MAVRWWRKAKRKRKRRQVWKKPDLHIEEILRWADAWKARTRQWPRKPSGRIAESLNDKWMTIDGALRQGLRGLPGGSSLAQLLAERRGVRNEKALPPLSISNILRWADAWKARTGRWPRRDSGPIPESSGDRWSAIDAALHKGYRGLPLGSSLAQLLAERRGARNRARLARLQISKILASADAWRARTGAWPRRCIDRIPEFPGDRWIDIDNALSKGLRGLPGGSTLAQLLAGRRGVRHHMRLPPFKISTILTWADAWKVRMGSWPRSDSGSVPQSPGDKWATVHDALKRGRRGLPGGSSLPQLLDQRRGVRNRKRLPHFKVSKILTWADAHHRRTGEWPRRRSGAIADAPEETWAAVDSALQKGMRGLPGGSTLAGLLAHERGLRLLRHLPRLSEELILSWADAHFQRTGAWPNHRSGTVDVQPSEKWYTAETALRQGLRGLPGGSSLYQLLAAHGRIKRPKTP